jgi:hypothetical protein
VSDCAQYAVLVTCAGGSKLATTGTSMREGGSRYGRPDRCGFNFPKSERRSRDSGALRRRTALPPYLGASILSAASASDTRTVVCATAGSKTQEDILCDSNLPFPAALHNFRALRAGSQELLYLCGGSHSSSKVCVYQEVGKTRFDDRSEANSRFTIDNVKI